MASYVKDAGVKTAAGYTGTTNGSFGTLPSVGNHVIVCISNNQLTNPALTGVNDNQSNSYAQDAAVSRTGADNWDTSANIYSTKVATSSGTYTITIDPTGADQLYTAWTAVEFSGLDATTHKDQTGTNTGTTGDANVTASGANSTAGGVAIAVAAVGYDDADLNIGDTPPTGYTNIRVYENSQSIIGLSSVYKVYSSSETSSASWTHDNVGEYGWAAVIVTYKDSSGSPATVYHNLTMLGVGG